MTAHSNHSSSMSRRSFIGLAGIATLSALTLAGCGSSTTRSAAASGSAPSSSAAAAQTSSAGSNSLVLVFSRANENYGVGYVETGNTMVVAQMIAQKTGADLFQIERVDAYPADYNGCLDVAQAEQQQDARPQLKGLPDLSAYDTVYLGTPVWWGDLPMPVYTTIESLDWNGKIIAPFCTHAGSGGSTVFGNIKDSCTGSTVRDGFAIEGTTAQNDRSSTSSQVDTWLSRLS